MTHTTKTLQTVSASIDSNALDGSTDGLVYHIEYSLNGYWEETIIYEGDSYTQLHIEGAGHMQKDGEPGLPQEGIYVYLPNNARFVDFRITQCEEETVDCPMPILPNPLPALENEPLIYRKDPAIYNSALLFPAAIAVCGGVKQIEGCSVVHFLVNPIRYWPHIQKLQVVRSMSIDVVYTLGEEFDQIDRSFFRNPPYHAIDILGLPPQTDNGVNLSSDIDMTDTSELSEESGADLLILTRETIRGGFNDFVVAKSAQYRVAVVTLEEIEKQFPDCNEKDLMIQNYLKRAYDLWKIIPRYLILGGNINEVPTHWEYFLGKRIASDHFYSELTDGINPDLIVSRIPVSDAQEAKTLCDHYIRREPEKIASGGKVLLTSYNREDYNNCSDEIAYMIGTTFEVRKRYDGDATKEEVIESIEHGVNLINYRGHGSSVQWLSQNGLTVNDLKFLNTNGKANILSIACSNNAIQIKDCFGCEWIKHKKATSFLGASVPSYTVINHEFDKNLWEGILVKGIKKAGEIFNYGIQKLHLSNPDNPLVKHTIYAYLLLGDPTAEY